MTGRGPVSWACRRGHPWTDATTYIQPSTGSRTCRRCASQGQAARRGTRSPAPPASLRPAAWMEQARCAQVDPELWFPAKGQPVKTAKAVCARCPVRQECLEFALAGADSWMGLAHGVWGGLTEAERRVLRRERRAAA